MTETTPAILRELAARAEQLATDIAAAGEHLGREGFRIPDAAGQARDVADALRETAEDQARGRARPAGACRRVERLPRPWEHADRHRRRTWCRAEGCERTWGYDRVSAPCSEPVRWNVTDETGRTHGACDGHAIAAREQIINAIVEPAGE